MVPLQLVQDMEDHPLRDLLLGWIHGLRGTSDVEVEGEPGGVYGDLDGGGGLGAAEYGEDDCLDGEHLVGELHVEAVMVHVASLEREVHGAVSNLIEAGAHRRYVPDCDVLGVFEVKSYLARCEKIEPDVGFMFLYEARGSISWNTEQ